MTTETPYTWPPDRWPTASEWRDWFISMPIDEQLERAEKVVLCAQVASSCLQLDHQGAAEAIDRFPGQLLTARHDAWDEGYAAAVWDVALGRLGLTPTNPHVPAPVAPPLQAGTRLPLLDSTGDQVAVVTIGEPGDSAEDTLTLQLVRDLEAES